VEVLTLKGLVTYYVLFFIQLESRRVCLAGITPHPEQQWMEQMGRNVTMQKWGFLANSRYLLHDRRALQQYVAHYHEERNHQGKQNRLLFPLPNRGASGDSGIVRCKERLGGLLKYYEREAA
jgi:hypothetical protein